jgi:DNA topoisomerase-1
MPGGLRHVSDEAPGITRHKKGDRFVFRLADGQAVKDQSILDRIAHLAIPPAYTDVWICTAAHGHLQATGRDARGRKQYLYHPAWRTARDETKFDRMLAFGAALPKLRACVARDLGASVGTHIERQTVTAAVVRLLDTTLMRVGNEAYARSNQSFGLTTLCKRHVALAGDHLRLRFKGKSGVAHDVTLQDKRIARVVKRCQSLPGQELFQFLGADGEAHGVNSSDVNDYLRQASGGDFTAKDFRTWHGSATALALFKGLGDAEKAATTTSLANRLIDEVAQLLGNTAAVCRKSYIHPQVLALLTNSQARGVPRLTAATARHKGLTASDSAFLTFLKRLT